MRWVGLLVMVGLSGSAGAEVYPIPVIAGDWWEFTGNPDLGEYTRAEQEVVDFGIWQAADGTWQLWACVRNTGCGGHTRLFYGWEGKSLTDRAWEPKGIMMEARPELGEVAGGMQSPFVVELEGRYCMAYGTWGTLCFAESEDGKVFRRVLRENGKPGVFSEGEGAQARDPSLLFTKGLWHFYYAAGDNGKGYDYCRTSRDLKTWSDSAVVAYGGVTGNALLSCQCPFALELRPGLHYFLRTHNTAPPHESSVHVSRNPLNFGIDNDEAFVCTLRAAAPELVCHEGQWYVAAMTEAKKSLRMARLEWVEVDEAKGPVFDFDDGGVREGWVVREGEAESVFTTSERADFGPRMKHFVGTAERASGHADDGWVGVMESPVFALDGEAYVLWVSGGKEGDGEYVAVVDAGTGEELARFGGLDCNRLRPVAFWAGEDVGREVRLRVVDGSRARWGHINFGGIWRGKRAALGR